MMKNKSLVLWIATITMLCFVFAGYAGGAVNEADGVGEEPNIFVEIAAQQTEMTEDIFVDIAAHQMYFSEKYSEEIEDAMELTTKIEEEMDKIYEKHGVTEEDYYAFAEEKGEDDAIMARVNERVEELKAEDE
ncbi:MAG: hypothetical protein ACQES1_03490 [Bacteroidota bacterium]